jgi:hypothetical protein
MRGISPVFNTVSKQNSTMKFDHTYHHSVLVPRNDNRPGLRAPAKSAVKLGETSSERAAIAIAVLAIAETDVASRCETGGVRSLEAGSASSVDRASTTADVVGPGAAVDDGDSLDATRGERVGAGCVTDKGELGVGGGEPMVELVVGDKPSVEGDLDVQSVSTAR